MERGKKICGRKLRGKDGRTCQKYEMVGRNGCELHGGKSLRGADSGTYRTGKYSKYLPAHLLEKYHEASNDPDLLSLHSGIALVDTRLADLLTTFNDKGLITNIQDDDEKVMELVNKFFYCG